MGEMADWVLDGGCCQVCGEVMDDFEEPGYHRTCKGCAGQMKAAKKKKPASRKVTHGK